MMYKKIAVILLFLVKSTLSIPLQDFYLFGANAPGSTTTLPRGNNAAATVFPRGLYNFFGERKDSVIVSQMLSRMC